MSDISPEDRERLVKAKFKEYADEWLSDPQIIETLVKKVLETTRTARPESRSDAGGHSEGSSQQSGTARHSLFDEVFLGIGRR